MMQGRVLLRLAEEVAHARRADADEHLHEVRAGDGEEGHARLAGDGLGEEVLPVPGGPIRSTPWGMRPPIFEKLLGVLEELDDLADLLLASSTPRLSAKVVFTLSR
jgi:hypothetical protein